LSNLYPRNWRSRPSLFEACRRRRGLTLVEILVASTIMASLLIPVVRSFSTSSRRLRSEQLENAAASFAQRILEQRIFGRPFDNLGTVNGQPENEVIVGPEGIAFPADNNEPETRIDGVAGLWVKYSLLISDHVVTDPPGANPVSFNFTEIPYASCGADTDYQYNAAQELTKNLVEIDRDNLNKSVLKDILVILEWRGVSDPVLVPGTPIDDPARRTVLLTRRTRLE